MKCHLDEMTLVAKIFSEADMLHSAVPEYLWVPDICGHVSKEVVMRGKEGKKN